MARVLLTIIRAYQRFVSPSLGVACRYEPTCSHYALEAIERHGAWRGLGLAAGRLSRCRPGGGSGYDPVPDSPHANSTVIPTTRPERHAGADASDMRPAR